MKTRLILIFFMLSSINIAFSQVKEKSAFEAGLFYFRANKPTDAIELFEKAKAEPECDKSVFVYLGVAYFQLKDYESSLRICKEGLQISGTEKKVLAFNAGNASFKLKNYAAAEEYYRRSMNEDKSYLPPVLNLGNTYVEEEKLVEALSIYEHFVEIAPDDPQVPQVLEIIEKLKIEIEKNKDKGPELISIDDVEYLNRLDEAQRAFLSQMVESQMLGDDYFLKIEEGKFDIKSEKFEDFPKSAEGKNQGHLIAGELFKDDFKTYAGDSAFFIKGEIFNEDLGELEVESGEIVIAKEGEGSKFSEEIGKIVLEKRRLQVVKSSGEKIDFEELPAIAMSVHEGEVKIASPAIAKILGEKFNAETLDPLESSIKVKKAEIKAKSELYKDDFVLSVDDGKATVKSAAKAEKEKIRKNEMQPLDKNALEEIAMMNLPEPSSKAEMVYRQKDFTPDGDGVDDVAIIDLQAELAKNEKVVEWSVFVYDEKGNIFNKMGGKGNPPAQIKFDGMGRDGQRVMSASDYKIKTEIKTDNDRKITGELTVQVGILVIHEGDKLKIAVPSIAFDPNAATFIKISDEQKESNDKILTLVAMALKKYADYKVIVEGHANNLSGTEKEERELIPLSEERAKSVKEILIVKGIDQKRLSHVGMGGTKPLGKGKESWKNRRVEFILVK